MNTFVGSVGYPRTALLNAAESAASASRGRPSDVFVNVLDVAKENWSAGNGPAQFA